jgi:acetolactate synthase-1/2/3 large subunit
MSGESGGILLARTLAGLGVKDVFALHGGHLDAFLVACPDEGIRLIDTRHEATAGHAADGYARATRGRIGVAVITAGPGFTNALTPMVSAYLDAIPTLFVAGSPPMREVETNPLQGGFDQVAMARPTCKWAHRITNAERVPDLVEKAVRIATTGRPGPVFLELPIDVMFATARRIMLPVEAGRPLPAPPAPSPQAVQAALEALAAGERPVIVAGSGTITANAAAALEAFVDQTGIPVVTNSKAHGVLPADHPAYQGSTATVSVAQMAGHAPDVVLLAGARAGLFTGGRTGGVIPVGAKVIQIDIDGGEIGRLQPVDVPIVADCREALQAMAQGANEHGWSDYSAWIAALEAIRDGMNAPFESAPTETRPGVLHPYHAAKAALGALDPDTTLVFDGGESSAWCSQHLRSAGPGRFMTNGYLGCLGCGPGMAIGAAVARPGTKVAVFTGDGAVGFNVQEFDTMVRHELPILTVVMNNACWGMSQHGQDLVYGANRRSVVTLRDTNYDQVAAAFGGTGERIDRYEDIAPAVLNAQQSGLPACINLIIDPDVVHPVTPAMVGAVDKPKETAVPYYENLKDEA